MKVTEFTFNETDYERAQDIHIQMREEKQRPKVKPSYVIATLGDEESEEFKRQLAAAGIELAEVREGEISDSCLQEA